MVFGKTPTLPTMVAGDTQKIPKLMKSRKSRKTRRTHKDCEKFSKEAAQKRVTDDKLVADLDKEMQEMKIEEED